MKLSYLIPIVGVSFEKKGSDRQNVVPAKLHEVEAGQICNWIPDKQHIVEEVSPKNPWYASF